MGSSRREGISRHLLFVGLISGLAAAGCGGGSVNTPGFTPIPAPALGTVTTNVKVAVARGQSAFVESVAVNAGQPIEIARATVLLPAGALLEDATLGVAVLSTAQSTLERIRLVNPALVSKYTPIAEVIFGRVDTANAIQTITGSLSTGSAVAPAYRIKLTPAGSDDLDTLLATAGVTSAFQVLVRDELSFNERLIQPRDCTVAYDTAQDLISVDGCRAKDMILTLVQTQP